MTPPRILLTAFDGYGPWPENSSWLTLMELTRELPEGLNLTTRRYPVDRSQMLSRLHQDLDSDYAYSVHLGQAPGAASLRLEAIALNAFREVDSQPVSPLDASAPLALGCPLPLEMLAEQLRQAQVPCRVSYHAGLYLCNAVFFAAAWRAQQRQMRTRTLMVHLPLATPQVLDQPDPQPALPVSTLATGVRLLLGQLSSGSEDPNRTQA
jgi:pyroglutamyl-peptidase